MENSFFRETAEEMVNRLFDEISTTNYLPKNFFSPIPELKFKSILIDYLKKLDNDNQEELEKRQYVIKEDDPDFSEFEKKFYKDYWEEYFKNLREQFILHNIIKAMYYNPPNNQNSPPPKPTHRQTPYLRLLKVNG